MTPTNPPSAPEYIPETPAEPETEPTVDPEPSVEPEVPAEPTPEAETPAPMSDPSGLYHYFKDFADLLDRII